MRVWLTAALFISTSYTAAVNITDIQGTSFRSPLAGQVVHDVPGVVTAKDRYGFWIQGEPFIDLRVSNGLRVYGTNFLQAVNIGDSVRVTGRVSEYRGKDSPNDLLLTEIDLPSKVVVVSSNNSVSPIILGNTNNATHRKPPLVSFTSLDAGPDGWLSMPNNVSLIEHTNATLQPDVYGLDFWESLEGQLVTVPGPVALNFPDRFGSFWAYGDWEVNGKNARGGLSLTFVAGSSDAHPETILIGSPLDGTKNPKTMIGTKLSDITGVVNYQFGHYTILPLTSPSVLANPDPKVEPAGLISGEHPCEITIGDYNVENMAPTSHHIPRIADHIVNYLNSPDIVFVQEIQDDSGPRDDGTVSANKTLAALVGAISKAQTQLFAEHWEYQHVDIEPENNQDGGADGGNIRVAYLWNPEKISFIPGNARGGATESVRVIGDGGKVALLPNPGRVDPTNLAWNVTRKPLAGGWQTSTGDRFFTVNVHMSSKRDSSSPHGDARPPVNGHSERRAEQVAVVSGFIESLLVKDVNASIIVAGDMNEFVQTRSVFRSFDHILTDINESSGVDPAERYTYVYDQNTQEIDQMFVSHAVAERGTKVEHVHLNTWALSYSGRASDHDPTVAKVWVCDPELNGREPSDSEQQKVFHVSL